MEGPYRQAHPQGDQHRHRRLLSRPRNGLPGAPKVPRSDDRRALCRQCRWRRLRRRRPHGADPNETLFIIASKTFTTLETMTNAAVARDWLVEGSAPRPASPSISSRSRPTPRRCKKFGIDTANMFGFWDWVGGRYSMDSAIGLSTMIAVGPANFRDMLAGFHAMDEHFRTAPPERNLPMLMGLLTIWYNNFFGARPGGHALFRRSRRAFPPISSSCRWRATASTSISHGQHVHVADRPDHLGRARHRRAAFVLSADPPGNEAGPLRLHRLLPPA